MPEKTITIRVDDKIHRDLKIHIAKENVTLKDYLLRLIKQDLYGKMAK